MAKQTLLIIYLQYLHLPVTHGILQVTSTKLPTQFWHQKMNQILVFGTILWFTTLLSTTHTSAGKKLYRYLHSTTTFYFHFYNYLAQAKRKLIQELLDRHSRLDQIVDSSCVRVQKVTFQDSITLVFALILLYKWQEGRLYVCTMYLALSSCWRKNVL